MPRHLIDLSGQTFGRLTVIGRDDTYHAHGEARWECLCLCGTLMRARGTHLRAGSSRSCGCLSADKTSERNRRSKTHGMSLTPEYEAYKSAKDRCTNPRAKAWKDYGGRGIRFLFTSFEEFFAHLGPRPSAKHSLDRFPNNDGHYGLGNVRWATKVEQEHNKRPRRWAKRPTIQ
jgi:hypothetical protein